MKVFRRVQGNVVFVLAALASLFCTAAGHCFVPVNPLPTILAPPAVPRAAAPRAAAQPVRISQDELRVEILTKLGDVAFDSNNFRNAIVFYQSALRYLRKCHGPQARLTYLTGGLSVAYCATNDMQNAVKYGRASVNAAQAARPRDPIDVSIAYNNLAHIYRRSGRLLLAQRTYESAISYAPQKEAGDRLRAGMIQANLAEVYGLNNKVQKCLDAYKQALLLLKRELPPDHPAIKEIEQKIRYMLKHNKVTVG
jgi:tetratricopeptide (TPR) repeat protein